MCTVDVMQVDVDAMGIRLMHVSECREIYCLHLTMRASAIRFFYSNSFAETRQGSSCSCSRKYSDACTILLRMYYTRNVLKFRWRRTETLDIH